MPDVTVVYILEEDGTLMVMPVEIVMVMAIIKIMAMPPAMMAIIMVRVRTSMKLSMWVS